MKHADYDLVGIGIGPFNLSLAALLSRHNELKTRFFEKKAQFNWHSEIMFNDSVMQTSFLKDLVTPVDPTNPHSFLNYLVQHGLFYAHLNTSRSSVSRREFEMYCQWVSKNLADQLSFDASVENVTYEQGLFHITANGQTSTARNICVGTGMTPWVPEFAQPLLNGQFLHAKSPSLAKLDVTGKRVVVVGGGQTGLEVFRNAFKGRWGKAQSVQLISRRHTLEPLDESPFTNEYFSPGYVRDFYRIQAENKPAIVRHQRFASDGNTPHYLQDLYNELYQIKHVEGNGCNINILPQRRLTGAEKVGLSFQLQMENQFTGANEAMTADVVIMCTGFRSSPPKCLEGLARKLDYDHDGRFQLTPEFSVKWQHAENNKIYAVNFGRHIHGIAEPQTSLMAWRSATIINDLLQKNAYPSVRSVENFVQHGAFNEND